MRRMLLSFSALAVAASLGCKPPPVQKIDEAFKTSLQLKFNELNSEANSRKDHLHSQTKAAELNPTLLPPTGTIYNTYLWYPPAVKADGTEEHSFIVENFKCQNPKCGTRLLLAFPSQEYLCKSCGHCPYRLHDPNHNYRQAPCSRCLGTDPRSKPKEPTELVTEDQFRKYEGVVVKRMYEVTKVDEKEGRMQATVRYIRRVWTFDTRGEIKLSPKIMAGVDAAWFPMEGGGTEPTFYMDPKKHYKAASRQGFHRLDSEYVGEMKFEFKGRTMTQLGMTKEEPVRPWRDIKISQN
jgi:hypothetical protein